QREPHHLLLEARAERERVARVLLEHDPRRNRQRERDQAEDQRHPAKDVVPPRRQDHQDQRAEHRDERDEREHVLVDELAKGHLTLSLLSSHLGWHMAYSPMADGDEAMFRSTTSFRGRTPAGDHRRKIAQIKIPASISTPVSTTARYCCRRPD